MHKEAIELKDSTILFKPELHSWNRDGIHFFIDGESPNWVAADERGSQILGWIDGQASFGTIVENYAKSNGVEAIKSWLHVHTFVRDAMMKKMIFAEPIQNQSYMGRENSLKLDGLKEFWIHLTQTCNLTCTHCLVSSGPQGEKGSGTEFYHRAIDEACELGVERFYFTGGEPFARQDIFELIRMVTETKGKELIILTNATLFSGNRLDQLKMLNREKIKLQVSLDGTTPEMNDAIRGNGVFEKSSEGLKILSGLGFETSLTAVATKSNLKELEHLPELAKRLGAKSVHLMWPHKRGRILDDIRQLPSNAELLELSLKVKRSSETLGIVFDNIESLRGRVNGQPGVKYDLGNLCWESLCLYIDGNLYPSAAMAGHKALSLGMLNGKTLRTIWQESPVAKKVRSSSVIQKISLKNDPFRFLTGGGDIEHSYFFSTNGQEGSFAAQDPYYELYVELMKHVMTDLALAKKNRLNLKSGFNAPALLHAMGEDAIGCSDDAKSWLNAESENAVLVRLLHSNCVLSFDVEKPYRAIQQFYGKAAEKPKAELCCPVRYDDSEISHIPKEVIDRFYGCGSPISMAGVKSGETVLDLGSGAGIDCFIAAKKVGAAGKVIGVDMTDQMLEVANRCKITVAANLGYSTVEFRKGFLEKIPADNHSVDLVTSNCVINLSPDKKKVFAEIWRILKDNGRFVVADIISDQTVPVSLQAHQELWGECISGSLSEAEFLAELEKAGFYGIQILKKQFWKEVQGCKFHSITVRGFKFEKKAGCHFIGQRAVYLGPHKAAVDEEGHLFPRGEAIEVCTDTAAKLKSAPYREQFTVIDPQVKPEFVISQTASASEQEGCCGSSGCC